MQILSFVLAAPKYVKLNTVCRGSIILDWIMDFQAKGNSSSALGNRASSYLYLLALVPNYVLKPFPDKAKVNNNFY